MARDFGINNHVRISSADHKDLKYQSHAEDISFYRRRIFHQQSHSKSLNWKMKGHRERDEAKHARKYPQITPNKRRNLMPSTVHHCKDARKDFPFVYCGHVKIFSKAV